MPILILVFIASLCSCTVNEAPPMMIYPSSDMEAFEGERYFLIARGAGEIDWYDNGAYIGSGAAREWIATPGQHALSCADAGGKSAPRMVTVQEIAYRYGRTKRLALREGTQEVLLAAGHYSSAVLSYAESRIGISFLESLRSVHVDSVSRPRSKNAVSGDDKGYSLFRDISLPWNGTRTLPVSGKMRFSLLGAPGRASPVERVFYYPDPLNPSNSVQAITASLIRNSDAFEIFLDDEAGVDMQILAELSSDLIDIFLPRVVSLFGEGVDVNSDGRVCILITDKINSTKAIIGFFNPMDCFTRVTDASSPDYNPYSNQVDMVYLSAPDASSPAYCRDSIAATAVHELCHLLRFGQKTLSPIILGDDQAPVEDLAVDEGLSHLSESLCGLGESGGNLLFAKKYFENSGQYSFDGSDMDGARDSAGKRGGMAALLWHLLVDSGGFSWKKDDPVVAIDNGGLAFLRAISRSRYPGWKAISESAGKSQAQILADWVERVNRGPDGLLNESASIDPVTGEIVSISPFVGVFHFFGNEYALNGPARCEAGSPAAAWSAVWMTGSGLDMKANVSVSLSGTDSEGMAFFGMF